MSKYYRPLIDPVGQYQLAGGWARFSSVEVLSRQADPSIIDAGECPRQVLERLSAARPRLTGVSFDQPRIMGILNATPDSFSDGGHFDQLDRAIMHTEAMLSAGADIIDIGGESTRPGADFVDNKVEIARTSPLIEQLDAVISIDTRKANVAEAALDAGAAWINDVSAMTFDEDMVRIAAKSGAPICLMHSQGNPKDMQDDPRYSDVVLDVYDHLKARIDVAVAGGVPRDHIIVDPGIGFGKTLDHNLALLKNLAIFHGLGCPILLGASRKKFIGTLSGTDTAQDRVSGSLAVALAGVAQGVQILRVHDVPETVQAVKLWRAING